VFKEYDVDADGWLSKEEMFVTMEEELPNKQAITDALDMLNSLYEIYDQDENGLDWQEFQNISALPRTAFTDVEDEELAQFLEEAQDVDLQE
jgi:Ca2+-binding EF-hand superfamily protein